MKGLTLSFGVVAIAVGAASGLVAACGVYDEASGESVDGGSPEGAPDDTSSATDSPHASAPCNGLDVSFGSCGLFSTSAPAALVGANSTNIQAIGVQTTGKIVLAGYQEFPATGNRPPFVMRVLADGSGVNTSFATDGIYELPAGDQANTSLALESDDSVVVAAQCPTNQVGKTLPDVCVYRLSADGVIDTTYGSTGVTHISTAITEQDGVGEFAIDAQGRALVVGFGGPDVSPPADDHAFIARLTAAGAIDPSFNGGAPFSVPTNYPDHPQLGGIVALSTGRILYTPDGNLAALTAAGTPDDTVSPSANSNDLPLPQGAGTEAVTAAPDDSTYAVGHQFLYNTSGGLAGVAPAILGLTPAGTFDPGFGDAGDATFASLTSSLGGTQEFDRVTLYGSNLYTMSDFKVFKIGTNGTLSDSWGQGAMIDLVSVDSTIGWWTVIGSFSPAVVPVVKPIFLAPERRADPRARADRVSYDRARIEPR